MNETLRKFIRSCICEEMMKYDGQLAHHLRDTSSDNEDDFGPVAPNYEDNHSVDSLDADESELPDHESVISYML